MQKTPCWSSMPARQSPRHGLSPTQHPRSMRCFGAVRPNYTFWVLSAVYLRIAGANNSIVGDAKVFLTRLWIRRRLAMGPYSMDLRERVAAVIDEGEGSQRQVA